MENGRGELRGAGGEAIPIEEILGLFEEGSDLLCVTQFNCFFDLCDDGSVDGTKVINNSCKTFRRG